MLAISLSLILSSARAINLPAGLSLCDGALTYTGAYDLEDSVGQVERVLAREPLHSSLLVEFFASHPLLQGIGEHFAGSVGVSEGFTLREHTLMVLDVLRAQEKFYDIPASLRAPLRFGVVFHDLGKPIVQLLFTEEHGRPPQTRAEFKECSKRQYEWTAPLFENVGTSLKLPEAFSGAAWVLVDGDVIGQVVTGRITPAEGAARLRGDARLLKQISPRYEVSAREYFALRTLLYVADAAAYPGLRYGRRLSEKPKPPVFVEEDDGRLVPVSPHFAELAALIRDIKD